MLQYVFYEATFMRDFFWRDRRCTYSKMLKNTLLNKSCNEEKKKNPYEKKDYKKRFNYLLLQYSLEQIKVSDSDKVLKCILERDKQINKKRERYFVLDLNLGGIEGQKCINDICESFKNGEETSEISRENSKKMADVLNEIKDLIRRMMNIKPDIAVIYQRKNDFFLKFLECKFESKESNYKMGEKQLDIQSMVAEFLCNKLEIAIETENKSIKDESAMLVQFARKKAEGQKSIWIKQLIDANEKIFY